MKKIRSTFLLSAMLVLVLGGCGSEGDNLSPSWWVRGVLIGLLILMVIRYMASRKTNGEDAEDKEEW